MKTSTLWAAASSLTLLLQIRAALAQAADTTATAPTTTTTTEKPSCTASLIAELCDYPYPPNGYAVASENVAGCWSYCAANPPCSFVIFAEGNPYLGTGTCLVYPGETYDPSKGTDSSCSNRYLSVYDQPTCSSPTPEPSPTETNGAGPCSATATPSLVASVCDYPLPSEDCFYECTASSGAAQCLSHCAQSDSCGFVVFRALNSANSPYYAGNCRVYPANATFDPSLAGNCAEEGEDGRPNEFVFENKCPPPVKPSSSGSGSGQTGAGAGAGETGTGTAGVALPANGAAGGSGSSGNGSGNGGGVNGSGAGKSSGASIFPTIAVINALTLGVGAFLWY